MKGLPNDVLGVSRETVLWLRDDSTTAAIAIGVAVGLFFAFRGLRWLIVRALGEQHPVTTWRGFLRGIVRRTRSFFIGALAAYLVTNIVAPPGLLLRAVDIVFTIAFAVQGAYWLREVILSLVQRRAAGVEDHAAFASAVGIITVLVNVVVWALALILVLDNLGVNVTALVAGLGVGGIAIGLAAQGIFGDLFAALAILFDRPFAVGDSVSFGGNSGTVEAIGLKTVRVRLLSGEQLIISNSKLLDQQVTNLARVVERRVPMSFGIVYQTPPEVVAALPGEVAEIIGRIDGARFGRLHMTAFGASSLDFELIFFATSGDYAEMMRVRHEVCLAMLRRFAELKIDFAYPTQVTFTAAPDGTMIDPRPVLTAEG
ncbi:mechanosensitive ion channel protein MscS [alpha proteobacterium AAP81b]|nr:mechanosensitive ion channel protein MscS [alpha proteobacterium AAP81b]